MLTQARGTPMERRERLRGNTVTVVDWRETKSGTDGVRTFNRGHHVMHLSRALIHVEIVDVRQRWVLRVRLRLIPVNGGRNIVL